MKKLFYLLFILFLSNLTFSGCATSMAVVHFTQSWGTNFSPYTQPPGYIIMYAYQEPGIGRADTKRGTGCGTYPLYVHDWAGFGYVQYDWGNLNTCTTNTGCPSGASSTCLVVYNQDNDGTVNHQTKFFVDCANYTGADFRFDDSTSVGQNLKLLPQLDILNATHSGSCTGADPCTINLTVRIPNFLSGAAFSDGSVPAGNLIAGAVVMYNQAASAPTSGDETGWTAITTDPENDQYFNQTQISGGTTQVITISGITSTNYIYLSYKPIVQYQGACASPTACTKAELSALDTAGYDIGYVTSNSAPIAPTPVTIVSFTAVYTDLQNVKLDWETASETDAMGFFLYRSTDGQNWTKVNDQLIPARGQGGAGATYTYNDTVPKQRTYTKYYYKVEEITNNGERGAEAQTETKR